MYTDLYRFLAHKLGTDVRPEPTNEPNPEQERYKEYELAINDPSSARQEFRKYTVPLDETTCIAVLEGYYDVLSGIDRKLADKYRERLREFVSSHNLRYYFAPDGKIMLSVEGLLISQFTRLRTVLSNNSDRTDCLKELENSLATIDHGDEEKNAIRIATNLLEGIVKDRSSNGEETLSRAIDGCHSMFPHNSLKEAYKNVYKFASDYPNIRHAGTATSRIRGLKKDDA